MSKPPQTQTFTHPLLGPLTGLTNPSTPNVTHFRSIPFALVPSRFRQSILLNQIPPNHTRGFTKYGTVCPSPVQTDQIDALGDFLPEEEARKYDEETCLDLTISAPGDALGEGRKLPVMVYVHDGGFAVGSGYVSAFYGKPLLNSFSGED